MLMLYIILFGAASYGFSTNNVASAMNDAVL
jgi:hypothetical protein